MLHIMVGDILIQNHDLVRSGSQPDPVILDLPVSGSILYPQNLPAIQVDTHLDPVHS